MVNSKHYLQNYQDINSPNYSTPNPKLWKNDIIKCFLETLSLFYLSVGNLQTISRLEVYQDLPSRNQTKVTVPSPNLITKLSPLLILPCDCYANRSDIPCDIISSLSFCQYSHHLASEGEKIWMKSNSLEFVSFCGFNMLMFTYPEIKLSFPLANTHTMMGLVQLSHLGNPGSDPIQFSIVPSNYN